MRIPSAIIALCLCSSFCSAQSTVDDAALLRQARSKYDAPFERNLKSFDCAVDFNWKKHWAETYRVGDEGTDEEIEKFVQHLPNRVTVTRDDAIMSSGMTEKQEHDMPHGGMAEGLLQHAVRFSLRTWLVASNNALLPATGTPVHLESSTSGYKLEYKIQTFDVAMMLTPDMNLQSMAAKGSDSDRQEFEFHPGPQGFLLKSWTMGEDGNFKDGNRMIFSYSYQTVDGFQIPAQGAVNRESHHEIWHYTLSDCKVTTGK
ncbi:MAG TPA: hypothetical protein VFC39_17920 [Acidobacteriaceae bacterium]|nr:hypothetical protein [Acidobacteriaceae bacterium]